MNGQTIEDLRSVTFTGVTVRIDEAGVVRIDDPRQRVVREAGKPPRLERRPSAPTAPPRVVAKPPEIHVHLAPPADGIYLMTEGGAGAAPFLVNVIANGRVIQTVRPDAARTLLDVTAHLPRGRNVVTVQVLWTGAPDPKAAGRVQVTLGSGERRGAVFAIGRVAFSHTVDASALSRSAPVFAIVVD